MRVPEHFEPYSGRLQPRIGEPVTGLWTSLVAANGLIALSGIWNSDELTPNFGYSWGTGQLGVVAVIETGLAEIWGAFVTPQTHDYAADIGVRHATNGQIWVDNFSGDSDVPFTWIAWGRLR